jgi:hypothetical protein
MAHTRDAVAALKNALAELPAASRTTMSTRHAIAELADTISGLRARGYTLDEVARILTERGIRVAPNTLRSYLGRQRSRRRATARSAEQAVGGGRRSGDGTPEATPGETDAALAGDTATAPVGDMPTAMAGETAGDKRGRMGGAEQGTGASSLARGRAFPYRPDDNDL